MTQFITSESFGKTVAITEHMISDMEEKVRQAADTENYLRAAELESYVRGMQQVLINFQVITEVVSA